MDMNKLKELQEPINTLKAQLAPYLDKRNQYMWELYQAGVSIEDIADALGFLPRTIESILKEQQKRIVGELRLVY